MAEKQGEEVKDVPMQVGGGPEDMPPDTSDDSSASDDLFEELFEAVDGDQWGPIFRKITLSPGLEENAIQFIKEHRPLWDNCDPKYCNVAVKRDLWNQLGEICSKSAKDVKAWWLGVRDLYIRHSVKGNDETASARTLWISKKLAFLGEVAMHRKK